jgi:exosome complex component RRP45
VQLGQTRVLVVVSCEVVRPYPDRPTEGFFKFNISFSPMASPAFGGRVSSHGVEIGRIVERGLRESGAIDTEALCIVAGEKVWSVRLDMHVLDDFGNLTDCCSIGAITALHHFKRPDVTISGDAVVVHSPKEKTPVALSIHHMPISISFAVFGDGLLVVDPQWKEEKVCNGRLTMTLNAQHELCAMQKAGGVALPVDKILEASLIAQVKVIEISEAIHAALQADKLSRKEHDISPTQLMTSGIGLEEVLEQEIEFMDIDGASKKPTNESHKRGLRFFQGPESLDLPSLEDDELDDEYVDMEEDLMQVDAKQAQNTADSTKSPNASSSGWNSAPAASPKKGPIIKQSKGPAKAMDILKSTHPKPKATVPSKAAKDSGKSSSSSSPSSTPASETKTDKGQKEEKRPQINKRAFEAFAANLVQKSELQKDKYKVKKRKNTMADEESD